MKYPFWTESSFSNRVIVFPVVVLFVWLFNSYKLGRFSKYNKNYKLWIIGNALLTLAVIAFVVWYMSVYK